MPVAPAGFQNADRAGTSLCQPPGNDRAGATSADHQVVEGVRLFHRSQFGASGVPRRMFFSDMMRCRHWDAWLPFKAPKGLLASGRQRKKMGSFTAMEIKWLLDFLSLVDTRNFSRSADQRATTQPAFSRRIRALEEWMGAPLFDRSKQPIELTPAGQEFRPVAEEVLRRILQSREEIRRIGQSTESTVAFTATHSLSLLFFPSWIRGIEQQIGVCQTRLDSRQIGNCAQSLMRGECHFMLAPTHATTDTQLSEERFTSIKVGEDRLVPVSAPDENGAPVHDLPGSAKAPVDYLAYVGSAASGHAVEHLLRHHPVAPVLHEVFASHLAGVLKSMVDTGPRTGMASGKRGSSGTGKRHDRDRGGPELLHSLRDLGVPKPRRPARGGGEAVDHLLDAGPASG